MRRWGATSWRLGWTRRHVLRADRGLDTPDYATSRNAATAGLLADAVHCGGVHRWGPLAVDSSERVSAAASCCQAWRRTSYAMFTCAARYRESSGYLAPRELQRPVIDRQASLVIAVGAAHGPRNLRPGRPRPSSAASDTRLGFRCLGARPTQPNQPNMPRTQCKAAEGPPRSEAADMPPSASVVGR